MTRHIKTAKCCSVKPISNFFVLFQLDNNKSFEVKLRFDTDVELMFFKHGGILNYMIRRMACSREDVHNGFL